MICHVKSYEWPFRGSHPARSAENLCSERTGYYGALPVLAWPGRNGPYQTGDATGAPTGRPRIWLSAAARAARGSPVPAGWRQAMKRSGRTRTAPSAAIWRCRSQVQRGSYRSPSRWPMRTASSGRSVSAASCRAASHHGSPSSPAISRNRPGADEVLDRARGCRPRRRSRRAAAEPRDGWTARRRGCRRPARAAGAAVGHDGRGVVAVAVLDVELAELHRLRPHHPQHGSSGARRPRAGRSTSGAAPPGSARACSRARCRAPRRSRSG